MFLNDLHNEEFNLPALANQESLGLVADRIESSFIDQQQLFAALEKLGLRNVAHLMQIANDYLVKRIQGTKLTLIKAQGLNHKKIAYDFLSEGGIQKPVFENPDQKKNAIDAYFRVGRVYINTLITEVAEKDPNLAHAVLNWLRRIVTEIAVDQGVSPFVIIDKLLLNEIYIPAPPMIVQTNLPSSVKTVSATFITRRIISVQEIHEVAQKLENLNIIYTKEEFVQLIYSEGAPIQMLKVREGQLEFIAYLFYRMFKPYDKNNKSLLKMNIASGHWPFLQKNLMIGTNTCPVRVRKIGSEKSKDTQCPIVQKVDSILKPIYKIYFPNSPFL